MRIFKTLILILICEMMYEQVHAQNNCEVSITGSFNSECIVTGYLDKDEIAMLESMDLHDCIAACKGNVVTYHAVCDDVSSYDWEVTGATGYQVVNQGQGISVTWGTEDWGIVSVSVTTTDGCIGEAEQCIVLIDPPEIYSSSVPEYTMENGEKQITICQGTTIYFSDASQSEGSPIVGHYWESIYGTASTPDYTITCTQPQAFKVTHVVINACGCRTSEVYYIKIDDSGKPLELTCYGTACGGNVATYSTENADCDPYIWMVEGGTVLSSSEDSVTVQWGNPETGYGVISLDGSHCGDLCDQLFSVKIPVISDDVMIAGETEVCKGNVYLYELPLWGSTWYEWDISPDSGFELHLSEHDNGIYLKFLESGNYWITADYYCDFLNCGTFMSQRKVVTVKPVLEIESDDAHICEGDTGHFYVNAHQATWIVYKNATALDTLVGNSLIYPFATAGSYRIQVSHPNYCDGPSFSVTVHTPPPPITTVIGDTVVCPGEALLLQTEPTSPLYYLEWIPECEMIYPQKVQGMEATFNFNEVCDIAVYQIDGAYGCRSEAFIHPVDSFELAPTGFPDVLEVCAGSTFARTIQDPSSNVLYEWTVLESQCASVQGSHTQPNVTFFVNHINNQQSTYNFRIVLKRTYCGGMYRYDTLHVQATPVPTPTISFNSVVCSGESIVFTASGATTQNSHYTWRINGEIHAGRIVNHTFTSGGIFPVTLTYTPGSCGSVTVEGSIHVIQSPNATVTRDFANNIFYVTLQPHCSYLWYYNNTMLNYTSLSCPYMGSGTYCCMVTDTLTGCSSARCASGDTTSQTCIVVPSTTTVSCTTATMVLNAPSYLQNFVWSINSPYGTIVSSNNSQAMVRFDAVGYHIISAVTTYNGACYKASDTIMITSIPDFDLTYNCATHAIDIQDNSQFMAGITIPSRLFTIETSTVEGVLSMTSTQTVASFSITPPSVKPATYTFTLTLYGCTKIKTITIYPAADQIALNKLIIPTPVCQNTPFTVSAPTGYLNYKWDFGDGSFAWGRAKEHTYGDEENFLITLYIMDKNRCTATLSKEVTVQSNPFEDETIDNKLTMLNNNPICPGEGKRIQYFLTSTTYNYTWLPDNITNHLYYHDVYSTGYYKVHVVTMSGCIGESMINVPFLNAPTARIVGDTVFCCHEPLNLIGNSGDFDYAWQIINPQQQQTSFTTPNIIFTPTGSGWHTALLTVSNDDCESHDTLSFYVNPQPPQPNVVFGSNACIHQPPVVLRTPDNRLVYWNIGTFTHTAYYYNAGYATAYYKDAVTGCKSATNQFLIPPALNYDALLTGCYQKCVSFFPNTLSVYRFMAAPASWKWYYNGNSIEHDEIISPTLSLPNYGSYFMSTIYYTGYTVYPECEVESPLLTIDSSYVCDCEDVEAIFWKEGNCRVDSCNVSFLDTWILISNHGSSAITFHSLNSHSAAYNVEPRPSSFFPITILPNDNAYCNFNFSFSDLSLAEVEIFLYDSINHCEAKFSVPIRLNQCTGDFCTTLLSDISYENTGFTESFNFQIDIPSNTQEVLALWSNPPQVQTYSRLPNQNIIEGNITLDPAVLSQLAAEGEDVCFFVILCIEDTSRLCLDTLCVPAEDLVDLMLEDRGFASISENTDHPSKIPRLVPNPANNMVEVKGIASEIRELQLFDITGKERLTHYHQNIIHLNSLQTGIYIVRVTTSDNLVFYLKLVKN